MQVIVLVGRDTTHNRLSCPTGDSPAHQQPYTSKCSHTTQAATPRIHVRAAYKRNRHAYIILHFYVASKGTTTRRNRRDSVSSCQPPRSVAHIEFRLL